MAPDGAPGTRAEGEGHKESRQGLVGRGARCQTARPKAGGGVQVSAARGSSEGAPELRATSPLAMPRKLSPPSSGSTAMWAPVLVRSTAAWTKGRTRGEQR